MTKKEKVEAALAEQRKLYKEVFDKWNENQADLAEQAKIKKDEDQRKKYVYKGEKTRNKNRHDYMD